MGVLIGSGFDRGVACGVVCGVFRWCRTCFGQQNRRRRARFKRLDRPQTCTCCAVLCFDTPRIATLNLTDFALVVCVLHCRPDHPTPTQQANAKRKTPPPSVEPAAGSGDAADTPVTPSPAKKVKVLGTPIASAHSSPRCASSLRSPRSPLLPRASLSPLHLPPSDDEDGGVVPQVVPDPPRADGAEPEVVAVSSTDSGDSQVPPTPRPIQFAGGSNQTARDPVRSYERACYVHVGRAAAIRAFRLCLAADHDGGNPPPDFRDSRHIRRRRPRLMVTGLGHHHLLLRP